MGLQRLIALFLDIPKGQFIFDDFERLGNLVDFDTTYLDQDVLLLR